MVTPGEALQNLERAESELESNIKRAVESEKEKIIDLLRVEQLFKQGIGTDGTIIGVYSKATESFNQGQSGPGYPKTAGKPFNFLASGEMYQSYSIDIGQGADKLYIINTAMSFNLFLEKTGLEEESVIGLTDENQEIVNWEIILVKLREYIREYI